MADNQLKLKHVTVIGVGLLGGSAALAIKACDPTIKIAGVGRRQSSLETALQTGAIDTAHLDPSEPAAKSELVLLATPVGAFRKHLRAISQILRSRAMVTDVGSTKAGVVRSAERILGTGGPFIGSHPMAGSEQKGVTFARADLFNGATCIITPTSRTPHALTRKIERFWSMLGMRTVRMSPGAHDRAVAKVSHLPHVLATLMMMMPAKAELDISATGFRDATRLASGDPEMWRDILIDNRISILSAINTFDKSLSQLRELLHQGDAEGIEKLFASAKRRREKTILRRLLDRRISAE